jgi:hypothetical protein
MGAFFGTAHSKGLRRKWVVIGGQWFVKKRAKIGKERRKKKVER